jgi:hypothetical protein
MDVDGTENEQLQAFRRSRDTIADLVEGLIALPLEALRPRDLVARVMEIGPKR